MGGGSNPSLTNEFQGQNTMRHCPLDIIVASGCPIIPGKKVGLGERRYLFYYCYDLFSLYSEIHCILSFFLSLGLIIKGLKKFL